MRLMSSFSGDGSPGYLSILFVLFFLTWEAIDFLCIVVSPSLENAVEHQVDLQYIDGLFSEYAEKSAVCTG